ncbi:hypothetical protein [Methylocapsa aurea]|uniref:hypothetical protein n=1 Tax=Methylocapsa aurea TaxID=663610 RepID=UPI00055F7E26|nr:hypothetical protein [Methylocapsa aurea]
MISRTLFVFICSGASAILASSDSAGANDLPPGKAQISRANAQCAAYGPGFTAVEGSDACVWVGGHVRVEIGSRGAASPNNGWATGGAAPAAMHMDDSYEQPDLVRAIPARGERTVSREHLRLRSSDMTGSLAR